MRSLTSRSSRALDAVLRSFSNSSGSSRGSTLTRLTGLTVLSLVSISSRRSRRSSGTVAGLRTTVALGLSLLVPVDGSGSSEKFMCVGHHVSPGSIGQITELAQIFHGVVIEGIDVVDEEGHVAEGSHHGSSRQKGSCSRNASRHLGVMVSANQLGSFIASFEGSLYVYYIYVHKERSYNLIVNSSIR